MIRDAKGNYEAVDFREAAPAAGHEDMYQGNIRGSIYGGLAVGVPSEVLGLEYIHNKYGVGASPFVATVCDSTPPLTRSPSSRYHGRRCCRGPSMWRDMASEVCL
jgi:hypothetical protein